MLMKEWVTYDDINLEVLIDYEKGERGDYFTPPSPPRIEIVGLFLVNDSDKSDIYNIVRPVDVKTIEELIWEKLD